MTFEEKQKYCERLNAAGYDSGISRADRMIVVFYNGWVWRVMGGDVRSPSLMMARELTATDVEWLVQKERKPYGENR